MNIITPNLKNNTVNIKLETRPILTSLIKHIKSVDGNKMTVEMEDKSIFYAVALEFRGECVIVTQEML